MKNTLVRGFVLVLALTGFGASTVSAKSVTPRKATKTNVLPSMPTPMCPLNDPNACGIDDED